MSRFVSITRNHNIMLPAKYHIKKAEIKAFEQRIRKDPFLRVMMELGKVRENPRALILISHGFVEMMIDLLVKTKCKNGRKILSNGQTYSHSVKLLILNETRVLDDGNYKIYDKFRKLRNDAAHNPLFESSSIDLDIGVNNVHIREHNLYEFCEMSIIGLWNGHVEIFGPEFAPTVMGIEK